MKKRRLDTMETAKKTQDELLKEYKALAEEEKKI